MADASGLNSIEISEHIGVTATGDNINAKRTANYVWDGVSSWVRETQPGGAGGGASTIADGADVAEGATTDLAVAAGSTGTVSGKLRQISSDISAVNAAQTSGTQQTKITDGTNVSNNLKSDGTAAGQNSQLTAGTYLPVAYTTTTVQAVGSTDAGNYRYVSVQINTQGTNSTVTFQGSNDNSTWVSVALMPVGFTQGNASTGSTGTGIWSGGLTSRYFRLNVTGISALTTAGTLIFSTLPTTPIDFGVAANLNQVNAVALLAGNGLTGTGSPRVTIASDNTAFAVNASIADGSDTTLGAKADARSTATDVTAVSAMSVLKEISFMEQNPASQAVTNAGTFAVQATVGGSLPPGTNAIGDVSLNPAARGGYSGFPLTTLLTTTQTVSAAAGKFGGYALMNLNSSPAYIQVFDTTAAVTLGTTVPTYIFVLPANSTAANGIAAHIELANGLVIANGIKVAATTTATGASTVATGISGTIIYK